MPVNFDDGNVGGGDDDDVFLKQDNDVANDNNSEQLLQLNSLVTQEKSLRRK